MENRLRAKEYRFSTLVETIVTSPQFLNARNPAKELIFGACCFVIDKTQTFLYFSENIGELGAVERMRLGSGGVSVLTNAEAYVLDEHLQSALPAGKAFDPDGNLYFAETLKNRVLLFNTYDFGAQVRPGSGRRLQRR